MRERSKAQARDSWEAGFLGKRGGGGGTKWGDVGELCRHAQVGSNVLLEN